MPCSVKPRCMRLMMSPRSPSSRSVVSAPSLDRPLAGADLVREAEGFQPSKPPDLQCVELVRLARSGPAPRSMTPWRSASRTSCRSSWVQRSASTCGLERVANVEIGARPQFLRDEILGAGAHTFLDVVARDDEILAVIGDAAHDDVDMRMLACSSDRRRPSRA